jgi:uncharacterized RDD family membrane protein YckC
VESAPSPAPEAVQPEASAGWATPSQSTFGVPIAAGPAAGVTYADLVPRIIAYVIDAIILGIGYAIVWTLLFTTLFITGGFGGVWVAVVLGTVGLLAASAVYFIYTWTRWRASPGQRILSLETVNAADGATIGQDMAIRRWLFLYGPGALSSAVGFAAVGLLSTAVSVLVFAYYVYLLYSASQDPRRQGFHDKQASTVVVRRSG